MPTYNYTADIKNSFNWNLVYQEEREVLYDSAGGYTAIPAFEIPITFDKSLLCVRTSSKNAKFTWRFSGVLTQRMELGTNNDSLPVASLDYTRLRINRSTLIHYPLYTTDYQLLFESYYWIKHIDLTIWEYVGRLANETDDLINEIRADELANIEQKVDEIATYGR